MLQGDPLQGGPEGSQLGETRRLRHGHERGRLRLSNLLAENSSRDSRPQGLTFLTSTSSAVIWVVGFSTFGGMLFSIAWVIFKKSYSFFYPHTGDTRHSQRVGHRSDDRRDLRRAAHDGPRRYSCGSGERVSSREAVLQLRVRQAHPTRKRGCS